MTAELPTRDDACTFLVESSFVWHQRFELVPGVHTPGDHPLEYLFEVGALPEDLTGKRVLDIGTSNGGAAFLMERRGADPVVAVDVYPPDWFGFDALRTFLGSGVEYVQGTVYELNRLVGGETFDHVLFWGVLYHLRHPLLALDQVRSALAPKGLVEIESAISDNELGACSDLSVSRFYRTDELAKDPSNWFSPTSACLQDWCLSSGLVPERVKTWGHGKRCMLVARRSPGEPEFAEISYEVPLQATPASS